MGFELPKKAVDNFVDKALAMAAKPCKSSLS
jgi:hypothetical protein